MPVAVSATRYYGLVLGSCLVCTGFDETREKQNLRSNEPKPEEIFEDADLPVPKTTLVSFSSSWDIQRLYSAFCRFRTVPLLCSWVTDE